MKSSLVNAFIKRLFDLMAATFGLLVLSPLILTIGLIIVLSNPGPVFYRGVRVGRYGKPFRIFKFRSMVIGADKMGAASTSEHDPRILPVGRILRKYKLDELPQLFNVWLGQMSFVGPRPEVQYFVDKYTEEEKRILKVRPGITDWASLKFNNEGEILLKYADQYPDADAAYEAVIRPEKLQLQLKYVNHHNIFIDLKLIFLTLKAIISK